MDQTCARCASPLPASARFCPACGEPAPAPDATAADAGRAARLSAAIPANLAAKMRAPRLTGERKPVTALFADVVGSTALAEALDPEDWTAIINEAIGRVSEAVYRYEGTIAKLLGDGVLAFFGAPVAHEDSPERAVRAALDVVAAIDAYAAELRADLGIEFAIRIGINTGPVVVGNVGSDLHYEFTPIGDAINVAARLQAAAPPGGILIAAATQRFIAPIIDAEPLGPIEVKGRSEPVDAFRVIGLRSAPGPTRGIAGLSSSLVGRDPELARLREALETVRSGRGRIALVIGEPGLGKSRLVSELRRAGLTGDDLGWVEARSRSYGMTVPYHVLLELVRSLLGVDAAAEPAAARATLDAALSDGGAVDGGDDAASLAHLLGLPGQPGHEALERLEPEALLTRYLGAVRRLIARRALGRPLVCVIEDAHWADASSVEALVRLLPVVDEAPVLWIVATRSDREAPGWRLVGVARDLAGDTLTEIALRPLSEADSRRLVENLLAIDRLPDDVRVAILAKAEGNPFFVEEVVRMLIDRGAIRRTSDGWVAEPGIADMDIPDNIHGLLLARIDRLPEDAKRALRVASVIGRQFGVQVLGDVLAAAEPR